MNDTHSVRITQTAATVASLFGFSMAGADCPIPVVETAAGRVFGGGHVTRALLYNPDAIAMWLYQAYNDRFAEVMLRTSLTLPVRSVMPSVTPVCFASMYTGLTPDCHGIQAYIKPVLTVPTLFDAAIAAGLRVAIVSTNGDSISKIFLERKMEYFFFDTPEECNEWALKLIAENRHEIIVVYNGNYDATMHRNGPESEASLSVLQKNAAAFAALSDAADVHWASHNRVVAFLPDHGCHEIDGNLGSHGLDMPDDMNIVHLWGMRCGEA